MDNTKSIVYICAHPDDIVSAAGTLLKLRNKGYKIYDFCLTRGQKGGTAPNIAEIRTQEEQSVCRLLDAELCFFDEMDGELYADRRICEEVAHKLAEIKPAAVITLWAFEKPDHAAAFGITKMAMHRADIFWTSELYLCQADLSGYNFNHDLYVNVSDEIDTIKKIAASYPSQWNDKGEAMIERKRFYGMQCWCEYAEGFKVTQPMVNKRWNRKTEVGRILLNL